MSPALQKLHAAAKHTNPAFDQALAREAHTRFKNFLTGIRTYRDHSDHRDIPDAKIIWQMGTTKLRDYNPAAIHAPVVLVIPSLINRLDILDLDLAPSFLRNLAAHGFRPLVVDWDEPGEVEKDFGIAEYVGRLVEILEFVRESGSGKWEVEKGKKADTPHPPTPNPHILGYCMGGLLALALASLQPDKIKSLTLMATPWDFHQPDDGVGKGLASFLDYSEALMQKLGYLPVDIIQSLFAVLQPLQTLTKFARFNAMNQLSMEARKFVLVEDWLNDGVPLAANVARECMRDWYGKNVTAKTAWCVAGQVIDPHKLEIPSYVVVPGKDKIVPPESALPLAKLLPHVTLHEPMTGHIGLMAGRNASQQIWSPLIRWLKEHG